MPKIFSILILLLSGLTTFAQTQIRTLDELINKIEPGWPLVQQWIDSAKNKVEILSCDTVNAKDALFKTQVTTRSIIGSIIYSNRRFIN